MTSRRQRLTATTLAVSATLLLGACGTNFGAQTNQQYQAAEGANQRGEIDVLNAVLVANPDGSAVLSANIVNQTDQTDAVREVTIDGPDGALDVTRAARNILQVPSGGAIQLGTDAVDSFVAADAAELAGRYVTITVTYASAEATTIEAPVVDRTAVYSDVFID